MLSPAQVGMTLYDGSNTKNIATQVGMKDLFNEQMEQDDKIIISENLPAMDVLSQSGAPSQHL